MKKTAKYLFLSLFFILFFSLVNSPLIMEEKLLSYNETSILFDSSAVSYSNTNSGMSTTNVQTSIEELYEAIMGDCYVGYTKGTTTATSYTCNKKTPSGSGTIEWDSNYVRFDQSENSLTSTTVQEAIDELASHIDYCKEHYHVENQTSSSYDCEADSYTITINAGTGISSVTGTGWTNTGTTTMTKSVQMGTELSLCESNASATTIVGTINGGYTGCSATLTTGSGTLTGNTFTVGAGAATITLASTPNTYTVNYVDNLFAATAQEANGVTVTYDEENEYIKLNGTGTTVNVIPALWDFERRTINSGDIYRITIKYISGTMTRTDTTKNFRFVFELTTDGARFSDRSTDPKPYQTLNFPESTSGAETTGTFTVDSSRASANGLQYWLNDQGSGNTTFTDYKVQVIITKVHSKEVTFDSTYGTLDTPTKTGHDFNGWWTQLNGGTQVTSSTTYNTIGDQTLYAHWTSHKLNVQYNGNGSDVTFCGDTTKFSMDSSKYVLWLSSSTRNIQTVGYGQYVGYSNGLYNWDNTNSICFSKTGYTTPVGQEWVLNGNTSKKYNDDDATITAINLANDAGCNLESTATCNARMNVNWTAKQYTVTYVDNLFVARSRIIDGITAVYTESGSYLTLNGITANKWMVDKLWNFERRTINAGDQYKITIKYVSGSYERKVNTSQNPRFYFELSTDGEVFSDRTTAPVSYKLVEMPLTGENSATFTVDSSRASANGLNYRIYQQTASNFQFNDYKVQIIITKVQTKTVTYGSTYGTLASNSKTGFDFDGWYTGLTDGTNITSSSTYNTDGNQTLYAHWTYHKLHVKLRSNASGVTWCGNSGTAYSIDSSNYALKNDSRNIHNSGYGQYISHSSGLANYHNTSAVCFNRSGYTAVSGKEWKLTYDGTTTYYDQGDSTVTAASMSTKAGCNLKTTDECNATLYVNWTSSGGGSDPTPAPSGSTSCTDEMACGGLPNWCHYGSLCYYGAAGGTTGYDCQQNGGNWYCGKCYSAVTDAACR